MPDIHGGNAQIATTTKSIDSIPVDACAWHLVCRSIIFILFTWQIKLIILRHHINLGELSLSLFGHCRNDVISVYSHLLIINLISSNFIRIRTFRSSLSLWDTVELISVLGHSLVNYHTTSIWYLYPMHGFW